LPTRAIPEIALPLQSLLRLQAQGPRAAARLERLAVRGDWRTRSMAVSALGALVRDDPTAWRERGFWRYARSARVRRVGFLRRLLPTSGARGDLVRHTMINALCDRSWIVRTAAALSLGECRDRALAGLLRPLLSDHFRPVRCAAAAALAAIDPSEAALAAASAASGDPAPLRIGQDESSREWIERLVAAHRAVVETLSGQLGLGAPLAGAASARWAEVLAGPAPAPATHDLEAEVQRHAGADEERYNRTKPFGPGHREQNTRLLHSFLVLAEQLDAPVGAWIVDLGGGGGWVSELLAKLGYRPVTVDIAPALLRVAGDRFARERLTSRFVNADMTGLPFADGSVDGVVVIDALHHVPDVAAVFREAYRVLGRGGQFLLAEPGEGHAEAEKSRAECSDHGVCEGEIHPFEAMRHAEAAGFDSVRVVPHYVPGAYFAAGDLRAAMREPSERWSIQLGGAPARFDALVLQSIFCHPILAFGKGQRALDSRAPGRLAANLEAQLDRDARRVQGTVRARNLGDTRWLRGAETGCVRLGVQLLSAERRLLARDFVRAELPADVPGGGAADIELDLALPDPATPYVLKLDMVDEQVCWFEDVGSRPLYLAV
jgi:SAM-dependent methyltransferase